MFDSKSFKYLFLILLFFISILSGCSGKSDPAGPTTSPYSPTPISAGITQTPSGTSPYLAVPKPMPTSTASSALSKNYTLKFGAVQIIPYYSKAKIYPIEKLDFKDYAFWGSLNNDPKSGSGMFTKPESEGLIGDVTPIYSANNTSKVNLSYGGSDWADCKIKMEWTNARQKSSNVSVRNVYTDFHPNVSISSSKDTKNGLQITASASKAQRSVFVALDQFNCKAVLTAKIGEKVIFQKIDAPDPGKDYYVYAEIKYKAASSGDKLIVSFVKEQTTGNESESRVNLFFAGIK